MDTGCFRKYYVTMLIGIEAVLTSCINSDKVLYYKELQGKTLALINSGVVCSFFLRST